MDGEGGDRSAVRLIRHTDHREIPSTRDGTRDDETPTTKGMGTSCVLARRVRSEGEARHRHDTGWEDTGRLEGRDSLVVLVDVEPYALRRQGPVVHAVVVPAGPRRPRDVVTPVAPGAVGLEPLGVTHDGPGDGTLGPLDRTTVFTVGPTVTPVHPSTSVDPVPLSDSRDLDGDKTLPDPGHRG